jgi:hypothetical protein
MTDSPEHLDNLSRNRCADVQDMLKGPMADAVRDSLYDLMGIAEEYVRRVLYLREHGTRMPKPEVQRTPREALGLMLREIRKAKNCSLEDAADRAHKSATWLAQIEQAQSPIKQEDLLKLIAFYQADKDRLLAALAACQ